MPEQNIHGTNNAFLLSVFVQLPNLSIPQVLRSRTQIGRAKQEVKGLQIFSPLPSPTLAGFFVHSTLPRARFMALS
jgi:hypothetical protein